MGGGASRAGAAVRRGGPGRQPRAEEVAAPSDTRPASSLSSRVQRVFASKFGSAAADSDDSDDDERERKNARHSKRAATKVARDVRPPSGRSEASNIEEKQLEANFVLAQVQEQEISKSREVLALFQAKPMGRQSKVKEAAGKLLRARDKSAHSTAERPAEYSGSAAVYSASSATQGQPAQLADVEDATKLLEQREAAGAHQDAVSMSSSSPSQSSRRGGEVEDDVAAREAAEAEQLLRQEAAARRAEEAARQAELEAAERAAAASAEEQAAAIATADDAYHEAETALAQNDLEAAREHHARGAEVLTAVGLIKCAEYDLLAQILQRISDTAAAWVRALADAEAAAAESGQLLAAKDFQGARAAVERAQESYSRANPEVAAASMLEMLDPVQGLLGPAEEAEQAELRQADALLVEAEAVLTSLASSCGKEGHLEEATAACRKARACVDEACRVLEGPRVGSGAAPSARRQQCRALQETRIAEAEAAAAAGEARRLLTIEENVCSTLYTQAFLLQNEGKLADAEGYYQQALDAARARLPADHHAHPMYQQAFDAVLELQGKGPKFEEARRLAEQQAAEAAAAAAAEVEAAAAERRRKEAEATAWKRDPVKREQTMVAAQAKRRAVLASRGRDKLRRAVRRMRMIRLMGGQ